MPPVVVAFPDCFTRMGGNQYVNSVSTGAWADFLTTEMLAAVEGRVRLRGGLGRRGVFGKSTGGYGAIDARASTTPTSGPRRPAISGDMACSSSATCRTCRTCSARSPEATASIEAWWTKLETAPKMSDGAMKVVNILAMAAHYDPDPNAFLGLRLPVTADTCEVIPERWAAWLAHDPVVKLERQPDALRGLKALYIDCGVNDQFNLLYGARRFKRRLDELAIAHRYEEFPDNHSTVDYRMNESLPFLAKALAA